MSDHASQPGPAWASRTASTSQASSSRWRSNTRVSTCPSAAPGFGSSPATWSAYFTRSGVASRLATSRIRLSERRLTVSGRMAGAPSAPGKVSPNPRMLETEAPRHP